MSELTTNISLPSDLKQEQYVDACIWLVKATDKAENLSRRLLYEIEQNKLYDSKFSSWSEFVESPDGLGKTKGWASKQLKIYKRFNLDGGFSNEELENIDSERLYLATLLPGTPQEQLTRSKVWSRSEIQEELRENKHGVHEHELDLSRTSAPCKVCGQWCKV